MESINEIAARWTVRADAGRLSPDDQRELNLWLAADPRHRGAYVRARAQWEDLDRLAALHGPPIQSIPLPVPVPEVSTPVRRTLSRRQLMAASVTAMTLAGGSLAWRLLRGGRERYASGIGEVRRIALADGSTVLLNTDSELTVHLTKERRDVYLVRGEALFEVAHDKQRPFVVTAHDTAVRAVGTAFSVRLESTQVDVTVTEGVVEVAAPAKLANSDSGAAPTLISQTKRVAANQRIVIARAGSEEVQSIAPAKANRQLAWREGEVSFDGESLGVAVAEINRHNRRQIVIDDPALSAMPVVGVFRATDLEGFSAAAAAALRARAVADGNFIRLEPKAVPPRN
jgi:transmembrane sensor